MPSHSFEWDPGKDARNRANHGLAFEDAALVWSDPLHLVRFDRVENGEERWHALGMAAGIVLLLVVHTYPGEDDTVIRIVSARKATKAERKAYEDGDP
ncbi:MAG: BrnT family toxin [Acetobacteraceae bacterium]|nr:BrnT family toxin [Acetobacteraceae bacterium]